ncbi:MAG: tetratricopeptide repeat protein [Aliarcobacter sp.]|nr:tetratricopeptide repeat protein [Aliarcobacter sp.]
MLKKIILPSLSIFLFTACSLKMPDFSMPSFLSFSDDKDAVALEKANVCQKIEDMDNKLFCYKKIVNENSYAQLRMGTYSVEKKDYKKAVEYFNQSIDNKNPYANLALAFLYYKGDGVEKDLNKSFELLQDSSNIDPNAAYQLSRFYLQGINTPVDNKKGVELIEFAASKNLLAAQKMLIKIYTEGLFGQEKDMKKVKQWQDEIKKDIRDTNFEVYKL